jgi:hypothetical protein
MHWGCGQTVPCPRMPRPLAFAFRPNGIRPLAVSFRGRRLVPSRRHCSSFAHPMMSVSGHAVGPGSRQLSASSPIHRRLRSAGPITICPASAASRIASAAGERKPAKRPFGALAADMIANNGARHGAQRQMKRRNFGSPEPSSDDGAGSPECSNSGNGRGRCPGSTRRTQCREFSWRYTYAWSNDHLAKMPNLHTIQNKVSARDVAASNSGAVPPHQVPGMHPAHMARLGQSSPVSVSAIAYRAESPRSSNKATNCRRKPKGKNGGRRLAKFFWGGLAVGAPEIFFRVSNG